MAFLNNHIRKGLGVALTSGTYSVFLNCNVHDVYSTIVPTMTSESSNIFSSSYYHTDECMRGVHYLMLHVHAFASMYAHIFTSTRFYKQ